MVALIVDKRMKSEIERREWTKGRRPQLLALAFKGL